MIESDNLRRLAAALGIKATSSGIHGAISDIADAFEKGEVNVGGADNWDELDGKPFGETEKYIVPETVITLIEGEGIFAGVDFSLTVGEKYTVNWNGTDYECVGQEYGEDGVVMAVAIGDIALMTGGESTGEPFIIAVILPEFIVMTGGITNMVMSTDGSSGDIPVSIKGKTVKKLDNKYLDLDWLPADRKEIGEEILSKVLEFNSPRWSTENYLGCDLTIGEEYAINWNGNTYICKANFLILSDFAYGVAVGNNALFNSSLKDTGEPFSIIFAYSTENGEFVNAGFTKADYEKASIPVTISKIKTVSDPIPEKYLPEALRFGEEEVTEEIEEYSGEVTGGTGTYTDLPNARFLSMGDLAVTINGEKFYGTSGTSDGVTMELDLGKFYLYGEILEPGIKISGLTSGETYSIKIAQVKKKTVVTPLPAKFMPEPIVFTLSVDMSTGTCNKSYDECVEVVTTGNPLAIFRIVDAGVTSTGVIFTATYDSDSNLIDFNMSIGDAGLNIIYTAENISVTFTE